MIKIISEDEALCRIVCRATDSKTKEGKCLLIVKDFVKHKNFDKTIDELTGLLNVDKKKLTKIIADSCIPCIQEEEG